MSPSAQWMVAAVSAGLPTLTVLVSLLINNQLLSDLDKRMDHGFFDLRDEFRSGLLRVEQVMDARLKRLEEHLQR
jgi:hypothetical protein